MYWPLSGWKDLYSDNILGLALFSHPQKEEDVQPSDLGERALLTQLTPLPVSQAFSAHTSFHTSIDAAL